MKTNSAAQTNKPDIEAQAKDTTPAAKAASEQLKNNSVPTAREIALEKQIQDLKEIVRVQRSFLYRIVDFLRQTTENSNWPSSVMSSSIIASAGKLLSDIRDFLTDKQTGTASGVPAGGKDTKADEKAAAEGSDKAGADKGKKGAAKAEDTAADAGNTGKSTEKSSSDTAGTKQKEPRKARHPGVNRKRLPATERHDHDPKFCPYCHGSVFERIKGVVYQMVGVTFGITVTDNVFWTCRCRHCGKIVKPKIPPEKQQGFTPFTAAFISMLTVLGMTRRHIQDLFEQVVGLKISQGAIDKCLARSSEATAPLYDALEDASQQADFNCVDETSHRRFGPKGKAKHWLWTMCNPMLVFLRILEHRSAEAFHKLVGGWGGLLVSDGYALYIKWTGMARQSCLAHLIRDAKKMSGSSHADIAKGGAWALAELRRLVAMARISPTEGQWRAWNARFRRYINKNKAAGGEVGTFALRLEREAEDIVTFLKYGTREPTNNRAERALRPMVCRRKVSFGSASARGEVDIARLMSLHQTCKLNGKSTYKVLSFAIRDYYQGKSPNLYWIHKIARKASILGWHQAGLENRRLAEEKAAAAKMAS